MAWNFNGKGSGSGIYKSVNGGDTWELLSTKESGFPSNENVGGLVWLCLLKIRKLCMPLWITKITAKKTKTKDDKKPTLTKDALKTMTREAFLKLDEETINQFLD